MPTILKDNIFGGEQMQNMESSANNDDKVMEFAGGEVPIVIPPSKDYGTFNVFVPKDGDVFDLPTNCIISNPEDNRSIVKDDEQETLNQSILEFGQMQPIAVRFDCMDNKFYLVTGNRRLFAARALGKKTITCIVKDGDPLLLSLMENLQRKDLSEIQLSEAFLKLHKNLKLTQKELAKKFNKSTTNISEILKINKLPEEIKNFCRDEKFSRRFYLDLLEFNTTEEMLKRIKEVKENVEVPSKNYVSKSPNTEKNIKGKPAKRDQNPEKLVKQKLKSTISAAIMLSSKDLSKEDLKEIRMLHLALGKILMIE